MPLDEDRIEELDSILSRDYLIDNLADLQSTRLIGGMYVIGTGVEAQQIVGNTQDRMVLAHLDLDAALAQSLHGLIKNGAAHLLCFFSSTSSCSNCTWRSCSSF